MGLGDWIMATSQVRSMNEQTGKRVVVVDRMGRPRWSEAFENNPRIACEYDHKTTVRLMNAGGARPYIRQKTPTHWMWQRWDIKPGELYLDKHEHAFGEAYAGGILIEPNTKVLDGNKAWPFARWQELVSRAPHHKWIQVGAPGSRVLSGVTFVETPSVRKAFGVLSASRVFVGCEGALHHAAAALDVPAVVLWSEFISPLFTGYASQRNIRKAQRVCGSRVPCASCRASMEAITVDEVLSALEEELAK